MYKLACLLVSFSFLIHASAQDAATLVRDGIAFHKEGKFADALQRYDAAIALEPRLYDAWYEKSYSLFASGQYEKGIELSKDILKEFPDNDFNSNVYVTYGSCYDLLGKPDKALQVYDKGIKKFPGTSLLYFNKAVTLYNMGRSADATEAIELAITNNPYHASSHNVLSVLQSNNRVYSMLASLVFLAIEPSGQRAERQFRNVQAMIGSNVKQEDSKTINITMFMPDEKKKKQPNDFRTAELTLSLSAALNYGEERKNFTPAEKLNANLETAFSSLGGKGTGFGWTFYAPFFSELKTRGYTETFAHYASASSDDDANTAWLHENEAKVKEFTTWFTSYWKTK